MGDSGGSSRGRPRPKGSIGKLKSGSLRVRVYAGVDKLSGRELYLTKVIPPGPDALTLATDARDELVRQIEQGRNPRTDATVAQMLERYLTEWEGSDHYRETLAGYVRNHVNPFLGKEKVREVDTDLLDAFYRELKRCNVHCAGRGFVQHRTPRPHDCDHRCAPHQCVGLGATTIRHIHFLLSGAYNRAKRWKWVYENPMGEAEPPAAPPPSPKPPTAKQAALIINEAWKDEDWGALIWIAMTTGARRGELCALRWNDIDFATGEETMWIARAIKKGKHGWVEGPTKTHQQRRVALDPETVLILLEHLDRARARAAALGVELDEDAFVYSPDPDNATFYRPDTLTQRYDHMVSKLKIRTTLHKLRHFSATELIRAGVDIRTVAGRIGHGGGGTTTLKVYAAFVSEADQRAARSFITRMPARPAPIAASERAQRDPRYPYEKIAAQIREAIASGALSDGSPAPTEKEIAAQHDVSAGTAHRVLALLKDWGLVKGVNGHRSVVVSPSQPNEIDQSSADIGATDDRAEQSGSSLLVLELIHLGTTVRKMNTEADPNDFATLQRLMLDAVRRAGGDRSHIGDYEMTVALPGQRKPVATVVIAA